MERRAFLAGVAAALAAPRAAGAQQAGRVYRIGAIGLSSTLTPAVVRLREAFLAGLHEHGYVEGKNIVLEWRYSEGRTDRFPQLVAELLGLKVDLLMVFTTPAARAAKAATGTVPILLLTAIDPVGAGFAASLARPGVFIRHSVSAFGVQASSGASVLPNRKARTLSPATRPLVRMSKNCRRSGDNPFTG